jgi:hypothetical protein
MGPLKFEVTNRELVWSHAAQLQYSIPTTGGLGGWCALC